jgi:hypothetical protein
MALTLYEVKKILIKCTKEEVLEIMDFADVEGMVVELEDFIEENLEEINVNLVTGGLV